MTDKINASDIINSIFDEVRDYELALKIFEKLADKEFFKKIDCYCCSCPEIGWDPACMNHGAHGIRGCKDHRVKAEDCDCGCNSRVTDRYLDEDEPDQLYPAPEENFWDDRTTLQAYGQTDAERDR